VSELKDKMLKLRKAQPQGGTIDTRSKEDQAKFKRLESSDAYPTSDPSTGKSELEGEAYPQSEVSPTPTTQASKIKPLPKQPPLSLQEWDKRQKELGLRAAETAPKPKEEEWLDAAPGEEPTWAESWAERKKAYNEALNKLREDNYSSDEVIGIGPDGKPQYTRRETGTIDEPPPQPVGIPPSGDGPIDTAMDIYRGSAKNYPEKAPIDEQKGFAVAASTWDYNNMGYSAEEPVAAAWVTYEGRKGEVREYEKGDRFFVSFDDDVIIRMRDRDSKSK
tara:strand:- start:210 stop:1040 length:831 start_codon:yes stop_codon:yes gene_type:complete